MKYKNHLLLPLAAAFLVIASTLPAPAFINVILEGTPGSSIIAYTISGSGTTVIREPLLNGVHLNNLNFDAFDPALGTTITPVSGTGTLTNTSTSTSSAFSQAVVANEGGFGIDDISFNLVSNLSFMANQGYSVSASGTFDIGPATFDDLNIGNGAPGNSNPWESMTLTIIPEPSRALLSGFALATVVFRRRRS